MLPPCGEGVAHVGDSALVVGEAVDHHRDAADAVALVAHFLVVHALELTGAALDRVLNVVLRHRLCLALVDRQPQPRVHRRVAAAHLGGHGDFLDQLGEDLAALGILATLAVLDVGPLRMSCHVDSNAN
jgi:hypothetical protein